jgi:uncharacterized protein (TIGR02246 family)
MARSPADVAVAFMAAINARDAHAVAELMHPDHRFIDAEGKLFEGREAMREGWTGYFQLFPDYAVECVCSFANETSVALFGTASGTPVLRGEPRPDLAWRCPAAWLAEIRDELVFEWRVYCDLRPQLAVMEQLQQDL